MPTDSVGGWVLDLAGGAPIGASPVCTESITRDAMAHLGSRPVAWAIELAGEMAERHIAELPRLGSGRATQDTLRMGTEVCVLRVLRSIQEDRAILDPTPDTSMMVQDHVRRGVPLTTLLASIRTGHAWLSEACMDQCRRLVSVDKQAAAMERISRILFEYILGYTDEVGRLYEDEQRQWHAGAEALRREAIRIIMGAESIEEIDTQAVSETLRYDLNQSHCALILRAPAGTTSTDDLACIARDIFGDVGARRVLTIQAERNELWAWGGVTTGMGAAIERDNLGLGIVAACGPILSGTAGFRGSHLRALEALEVADIRQTPGRVTLFDEVSLLTVLLADQERARSFMLRELGGLADDGENLRALRETLRVYLECRRSPQIAAEQLYVARNTVVYRIKRAEEVLGRQLGERTLELWTALSLAKVLLR